MSEKGQTTDLIEHLRKKMIERAEGRGLQDSEVIRIIQLLDVHLVALMRPRVEGAAHANSPSAEQSHLPPASGEGRRWDVSRIRLHRRRFQVIGRALDTTGWS